MSNSSHNPAFFIGKIPVYGKVILAPMDGFTDYPFRQIAHQYGNALSYTEFINCIDVTYGHPHLQKKLTFAQEERPIVFQIFDDDAQRMLESALKLEKLEPDIIDMNIGCSARNVSNRGAGAGLLKDPVKIAQIASSLVKNLHRPVTAKIRLGWDDSSLNYLEIGRILEDSGVSLVALHGRTRRQEYSGQANWRAIGELKNTLKIPVIGNGDIKAPEDIDRMLNATGCDAVMIGRAALGNPWILAQKKKEDIANEEILHTMIRHLKLMCEFYGTRLGVMLFRKHLARYLSGRLTTSELRTWIFNLEHRDELISAITGLLAVPPEKIKE
ncbi:MAG: tRNA dihydrouridine synthase DusB [Anaerolineaceae bacterium]